MLLFLGRFDIILKNSRILFYLFCSLSFNFIILRNRATSIWYQSLTLIRDQVIYVCFKFLIQDQSFFFRFICLFRSDIHNAANLLTSTIKAKHRANRKLAPPQRHFTPPTPRSKNSTPRDIKPKTTEFSCKRLVWLLLFQLQQIPNQWQPRNLGNRWKPSDTSFLARNKSSDKVQYHQRNNTQDHRGGKRPILNTHHSRIIKLILP